MAVARHPAAAAQATAHGRERLQLLDEGPLAAGDGIEQAEMGDGIGRLADGISSLPCGQRALSMFRLGSSISHCRRRSLRRQRPTRARSLVSCRTTSCAPSGDQEADILSVSAKARISSSRWPSISTSQRVWPAAWRSERPVHDMAARPIEARAGVRRTARARQHEARAGLDILPVDSGRLRRLPVLLDIGGVDQPTPVRMEIAADDVIVRRRVGQGAWLGPALDPDDMQPHLLVAAVGQRQDQLPAVGRPGSDRGVVRAEGEAAGRAGAVGRGHIDAGDGIAAEPGPGHPAAIRRHRRGQHLRQCDQRLGRDPPGERHVRRRGDDRIRHRRSPFSSAPLRAATPFPADALRPTTAEPCWPHQFSRDRRGLLRRW